MKHKKIKWAVIILCFSYACWYFAFNSNYAESSPIVEAARSQKWKTLFYNPSYVKISYPNGDVPLIEGVCTDVVIRALRKAHNYDLQKLVHEDMRKNFNKYPNLWGAKKTDRNIDHRRVPNLRVYFKRNEISLKVDKDYLSYKPGDIVTCSVKSGRPHIMIVSNKLNRRGIPYIIHNIGLGAREDDSLFKYKLTGHYRLKVSNKTE